MEDVLMQLDNPPDDVDDGESPIPPLALHDAAASPPASLDSDSLVAVRARVLSGAYDSLEMADRVARAILRGGAVALSLYE